MIDKFNRKINYLRISVTDRCNLRCYYCMPENGFKLCPHKEILTFEKIVEIAKEAAALGVKKIRLTGGEPLLRRDIIELINMLSKIDGIKDLCMTTNGILLAKYAKDLKKAGLSRINISLDTTSAKKFSEITRGGNIADVFAGIDSAITADFSSIKLNCTIKNSTTEKDASLVKDFAKIKNLEVRFIKLMDFHTGTFSQVIGGEGGNCKNCNRLRVLSNGDILPCLFSDLTFNIHTLGIKNALEKAVANKPEKGLPCNKQWMGKIGG